MSDEAQRTEYLQLQTTGIIGLACNAFSSSSIVVLLLQSRNTYQFEDCFILLGSIGLALFFMRFLTNIFCSKAFRLGLQIAAIVFLVTAIALLFQFSFDGLAGALCALLLGLYIAFTSITWITFLSVQKHTWLVFLLSLSVLVSGLLICLIANAGMNYLLVATLLAGIFSFACMPYMDERCTLDICELAKTGVANYSEIESRKNYPSLIMSGLSFGIVIGVLTWINDISIIVIIIGSALVIAAFLLLYLRRLLEFETEHFLLEHGVLLCSLGIALLPFTINNSFIFGCVCGYLILLATANMMTSVGAIVETARFEEVPPAWLLSKQGIWIVLGALGGCVLFVLIPTLDLEPSSIVATCFVSILVYQLLDSLASEARYPQEKYYEEEIAADPDMSNTTAAEHEKANWNAVMDAVAAEHDLTARQKEVMELLAKGRDSRYIEESFVVSRATVKTHIANLYRKMGIHSKRELIDYLENYANEHSR